VYCPNSESGVVPSRNAQLVLSALQIASMMEPIRERWEKPFGEVPSCTKSGEAWSVADTEDRWSDVILPQLHGYIELIDGGG